MATRRCDAVPQSLVTVLKGRPTDEEVAAVIAVLLAAAASPVGRVAEPLHPGWSMSDSFRAPGSWAAS